MSSEHPERSTEGLAADRAALSADLKAMMQELAEELVVSEAALYADGGRRVTVEHGEPLTPEAAHVLARLQADVETAVDDAGYVGGGTTLCRPTSITWTFGSRDVPARDLVLAVRDVADRHNPGTWVITADDHL